MCRKTPSENTDEVFVLLELKINKGSFACVAKAESKADKAEENYKTLYTVEINKGIIALNFCAFPSAFDNSHSACNSGEYKCSNSPEAYVGNALLESKYSGNKAESLCNTIGSEYNQAKADKGEGDKYIKRLHEKFV